MWFQSVPRLGSFMAVPIIYDSCLSDDALTQAVRNYQEVEAQKEAQLQQQQSFNEDQLLKQENALANGESYEPEFREWPEIEYMPFVSTQSHFVVCLDTMG